MIVNAVLYLELEHAVVLLVWKLHADFVMTMHRIFALKQKEKKHYTDDPTVMSYITHSNDLTGANKPSGSLNPRLW